MAYGEYRTPLIKNKIGLGKSTINDKHLNSNDSLARYSNGEKSQVQELPILLNYTKINLVCNKVIFKICILNITMICTNNSPHLCSHMFNMRYDLD